VASSVLATHSIRADTVTIICTIKFKLPASLTRGKLSCTDSSKPPVKSYCKSFPKKLSSSNEKAPTTVIHLASNCYISNIGSESLRQNRDIQFTFSTSNHRPVSGQCTVQ